MIVADSDVLIDCLRGKEPSFSQVRRGVERGTLATTAVTVFELVSGASGVKQTRAIRDLLGALPVLPFDQSAGETAALLRRELEAKGQGIGMADYLIAGICVSRSASLLTRNRKHFQRIAGLTFADS